MAGVKGRSGGPRKNAGGARPGAGRKPKNANRTKSTNVPPPKTETIEEKAHLDALEYLMKVVNDPREDPKLRVRAAIGAAQYTHIKKGEGGKKEGKQEAAKKAAAGKFSAPAPPRLVVDNNRK